MATFFLRLFSTPGKTDGLRVLHCPRMSLLGFRCRHLFIAVPLSFLAPQSIPHFGPWCPFIFSSSTIPHFAPCCPFIFSSSTIPHFVPRYSTSLTFTTCHPCLMEQGHLDPDPRGVPGMETFSAHPQKYFGTGIHICRLKSDVLRRKQTASVAEDRIDISSSNEQPSLLHQLVPALSTSSSVSSSSSTSSSFSTSSSSAPQLSAFRALVEQTEKGVNDSPV